MNNILITGAAGFIGGRLIEPLIREGNKIIAYDNLSRGNLDAISGLQGLPGFSFIKADMLDLEELESAVSVSDIVIHLAANPLVALANTDTGIDFESLRATNVLLEAMRKSPRCKRIIFTSTSAVYGEAKELPTPENYCPLEPISLYGASKLAGESLISGYCHMFDMSSVIFRLANIIGPTNTHGVLYDFITKLSLNPRSLQILGDGKQNKSYLHVDDCISALLIGLKLCKTISNKVQVYNVGSEDKITVLGIANIIVSELSLKDVVFSFLNETDGRGWLGDVREYLLECSKIRAKGWQAKYNSKGAVVKTAREYISKISGEK